MLSITANENKFNKPLWMEEDVLDNSLENRVFAGTESTLVGK